MAELVSKFDGVTYDELIGGTAVAVMTANVTIAKLSAAATYKRGTLLGVVTASGKYAIVDSAATTGEKVASVVLAKDIEVGTSDDVVATVYTCGIFNREKLIVKAESDSASAHEEELRKVGIYLTSVK
jgi:hypothetical protein